MELPPPVINSSKLIAFAENDENVTFTDRISLYVGGSGDDLERLGEMPYIAVCQPYNEHDELLIFFCDNQWEPKGTIPCTSLDEAIRQIERGYKGISENIKKSPYTQDQIDNFLRNEYEVDPHSRWWEMVCSFCNNHEQKEGVSIIIGNRASICRNCIMDFYKIVTEENA